MILFDILLWFWLVLKVALKWTSRAIVKRIHLLSESVVKNFVMPKTPYKIGAMKKNQVYKRIYCF